jgi:hypothetical protein
MNAFLYEGSGLARMSCRAGKFSWGYLFDQHDGFGTLSGGNESRSGVVAHLSYNSSVFGERRPRSTWRLQFARYASRTSPSVALGGCRRSARVIGSLERPYTAPAGDDWGACLA